MVQTLITFQKRHLNQFLITIEVEFLLVMIMIYRMSNVPIAEIIGWLNKGKRSN